MTNQQRARLQFATWLKNAHPALYAKAISSAENMQSTLAGLGEEPEKSFWQKFVDTATSLGTTYLTLKNQRDAMELNLERAKQGQPPLDVSSTAPVVRTQVDVSPELAQKLVSSAGEGLNKTLIYAGVGILAALLLKKFL